MKEDLIKILRERRPNISDSTLKTYASLILSLNKKVNNVGDDVLEFFTKKYKLVIDFIKEHHKSEQTIKTILSSLFILTNVDEYRKVMIDYCKSVNENYKQSKVANNRQEQLNVTIDDLKDKCREMLALLKKNPTIENYQNYFITAVTSSLYFPPRRNLDWISMKCRNVNKKEDNYFDKNFIYFQKFKTRRYHDDPTSLERRIPMPAELYFYLKKFQKVSEDSDYLFYNKKGDPMTSPAWTKVLTKIYKNNITTDIIRSLFISDYLKGGMPSLQEFENTMAMMGSSVNSALLFYNKVSSGKQTTLDDNSDASDSEI